MHKNYFVSKTNNLKNLIYLEIDKQKLDLKDKNNSIFQKIQNKHDNKQRREKNIECYIPEFFFISEYVIFVGQGGV